METKFTKGEWKIEDSIIQENEHIKIKSGRINTIVCDNKAIAFCGININPQAIANAKLIAAAPDLLYKLEENTKILKAILDLYKGKLAMTTEFGIIQQIKENEQAIKKATE